MATIHELHTKLVNKEISAVELTNAVISHKAKSGASSTCVFV